MAFPAVFISTIACAQFDIGVSVGAFAFDIHPKRKFISYYTNAFSARHEFYPTISISFNERRPTKRVNFTCSLDYAYKEFHAIWGDGGHGFGNGGESDLFLHMVYATIAPDILLGSAKQAAFRLGLQLGTAVIGHEQGEHWSFGSNGNTGYSERIEIDEDQYWHRTESRAVLGLRITPEGKDVRWLMVDLYGSIALSSLVGISRGSDIGIRVGYLFHVRGRTLIGGSEDLAPIE
jgi:hypothetical protein